MAQIHRAHLQHGIPKIDLLTWAYVLTGGSEGFIRVSNQTHIYDKIYGDNDVVVYLNRLHMGIFGMRCSFARHLGNKGHPLSLSSHEVAIKYFALHLSKQYPRVRDDAAAISWVGDACLLPQGFDHMMFMQKRVEVEKMQIIF